MTANPTTLKRMTSEQRQQWEEDGYLVIKNALSNDEVIELTREVDVLDLESQRQGRDPNSLLDVANILDNATEGLFEPNSKRSTKRLQNQPNLTFLRIVDHSNHLGLVCELMGAAVQLTLSQALVRPPTPLPSHRWHPDGPKPYYFRRMQSSVSYESTPPLLQLKIAFYLTDIDKPDMANLCVIPGSHKTGFPKIPKGVEHALKISSYSEFKEVERIDEGVPGAKQIMAGAGDAVAMHNGLLHCVVRNTSNTARKNLHYTYGPQWQRPGDRMESSPELLSLCNPVQKQLLGEFTQPNTNGGYGPFDDGAPLIQIFEGKNFQETWDDIDRNYILKSKR